MKKSHNNSVKAAISEFQSVGGGRTPLVKVRAKPTGKRLDVFARIYSNQNFSATSAFDAFSHLHSEK